MTGAVQAAAGAAAAAASFNFQVTTGTGGASTFGFQSGTYGAMAPSTIKGATVVALTTSQFNGGLTLTINGTLTQGFITRILVETDIAGTYANYAASAATFGVFGGPVSRWIWSGANPWNSASLTRKVLVFY